MAVTLSFAYGMDAESPLGDGMILGLFVLAVPLWPLTMTFWAIYMIRRHAELHPAPPRLPGRVRPAAIESYGVHTDDLTAVVPLLPPVLPCQRCRGVDWRQASPIRDRFGSSGAKFCCLGCGRFANFDIDGQDWRVVHRGQ